MEAGEAAPDGEDDESLRFEDLTVDDDLPLLDRVVRYCRSSIALQRLVHVKMLAETAETVGSAPTLEALLPVFEHLVQDPESVIRQHVAAQILPVSLVAMVQNIGFQKEYAVQQMIDNPLLNKDYYDKGYKAVCSVVVVHHIRQLVTDPDIDVRRSASDALAGLALQLQPDDVGKFILPIPLKLVKETAGATTSTNKKGKPTNEADALQEDLRITAANLLAEVGGAAAEHKGTIPSQLVQTLVLPAVLSLAEDGSFRVRRSAAQALPRVLGGSSVEMAQSKILPAFEKLSNDDLYRVRKSTGECLVDMSRSFMILASRETDAEQKALLQDLRRTRLIPIVERLIGDSSRLVRHGMMQFLGPFIASFYPYVDSALHAILPGISESDGSNHTGIVAQFFPHASSMVSRLNSSAATTAAPTPIAVNIEDILNQKLTHLEKLQKALPQFLRASRLSSLSLHSVVTHRREHAPPKEDLESVVGTLLEYFAALAMVTTGDENTDAEMRVYCAYSYPAVALVLGEEHWEGLLKTCFLKLLNPKYEDENTQAAMGGNKAAEGDAEADPNAPPPPPPLPVKRCLASSLHTVAHILGPDLASKDIMPIFKEFFLRDPDDSVRLNVFRNFPSLLSLLKPEERQSYLAVWSEVILGEEFLGSKKRSATNPLVLNWRQRDYLARSLPDLLGLISPADIKEFVWPIIKVLVLDAINIVRDDAIWAVPMLLRAYCPENIQTWEKGKSDKDAKAWSKEACSEAISWLKESILRIKPKGAAGRTNFNQRQLYCRICAAAGLALQFGDFSMDGVDVSEATKNSSNGALDPVPLLVSKFKSQFSNKSDFEPEGPYLRMTAAEQKHIKSLLIDDLLTPAVDMKDDRIMNVRLGLLKVLELMPDDVIQGAKCGDILQGLVEEMETWESFDNNEDDAPFVPNNGGARSAGGDANNGQANEGEGGGSSDDESGSGSSSDEGSVVSDDDIDEGSYSSEEELAEDGSDGSASPDEDGGKEGDDAAKKDKDKKDKKSKDSKKKDSKKEKKSKKESKSDKDKDKKEKKSKKESKSDKDKDKKEKKSKKESSDKDKKKKDSKKDSKSEKKSKKDSKKESKK
ncbi:protein phosphatase 4 regulatory subunit 1 [Seminavis robusta]|uniref:Protein phosphatase 4 regulatory subunit 1 n=1 Tax=Seminavis robusta TaxID=568900 RepID=A0A9N8DCB7_9STRA|nr:protein phosphatase 4 regulatory subunit 1 [Seminavis robusta]|eukprot:Sro79_g042620.1 protein phosphatase 4 regulatory subunit 1 (1093) ;mRNA; r:9148-12801